MLGLTIIRTKTLKSMQEQLSTAKNNLGKKIQHIQTLNSELELLKVRNEEMYNQNIQMLTSELELLKVSNEKMYNQIHCKPHDAKGRFCKKEDDANVAVN